MARKTHAASTRYTIAVIDDNREYLLTTAKLLEREGHTVIATENPIDALELLKQTPVDLVLVDYFMPEMTGEVFINELRRFNSRVQIILQTGYASEQPPREMLRRLDIQGYFDKSEGPDKLRLWVDVGLRAAHSLQALEKSRAGLRYILGATPELHRMQPLEDLLQGILLQTAGLLGVVDSFLAVVGKPPSLSDAPPPNGFVALIRDATDLELRAGTGRFSRCGRLDDCLPATMRAGLDDALGAGRIRRVGDATVVPLRVGSVTTGAIYLDRPIETVRDLELVEVFANQAAVAIHNAQLYQMAAFDPLTGAYTRRFFDHLLLRELRSAHRARTPLSLMMVDVDGMKRLNDTGGHLCGDQALAQVGKVLRAAIRATDGVGRYGGDEFVIVLPNTPRAGAEIVVERIRSALASLSVETPRGRLDVRASLGLAILEPDGDEDGRPSAADAVTPLTLTALGQTLIQRADEELYAIKQLAKAPPRTALVSV